LSMGLMKTHYYGGIRKYHWLALPLALHGTIIKAYDDQLTRFNIDSFEKVIRQQAEENDKIITILNFPHNPSGYSLSIAEAQGLQVFSLILPRREPMWL